MRAKFVKGGELVLWNCLRDDIPLINLAPLNRRGFNLLAANMRMRFSNHGRNKKGFNGVRGYFSKSSFDWLKKYLPRIKGHVIGRRRRRVVNGTLRETIPVPKQVGLKP